ncbi:hypothetical protein H5410_041078 [Solanum commersonii]|uniref:Ubiquitin-like protease family profile domain-containing protein n=1 Tax=Solanum commersonii TaxID=4109 RepID=A0A9J5XTG1_SOLCO|nr:hypothetical protein H5410_041078 [Solanum commersonii]
MCRMLLHFSEMLVYIPTELSYVRTYHLCVRATKWSSVVTKDSSVATEDSFVATEDQMIQEVSSMTTTQSFIGVASSSNIKCFFLSMRRICVKELTDIFKEMTYNIDVHTSKKISQPLKCRRLKKYISQSLSIISKRKTSMTTTPVSHSTPKGKEKKEEEEEKEKEKEKVKKKAKKKKVEVVSCDVNQHYPFEGFNIDGEGPTELIRDKEDHYLANCSNLEFKQLDFVIASPKKKDRFYVMSQPNRKKSKQQSHSKYRYTTTNYFFKTYIDNAMLFLKMSIESLAPSKGLVYLFHWVLAVVVLKERCIKVYDSMSSSRTNRKLCYEIQKLSTLLPKYLESIRIFDKKDRTNWSVLESYQEKNKSHTFKVRHITGIAQQAINSLDYGLFVAAYAEFLSDGLQVPSYEIISQTFRMRYALLLWNYEILKA